LERWAVRLVSDHHPGTFSYKHVLMVPGLNHAGLAQALGNYTDSVHYADSLVYFALPGAIHSQAALDRYAGPALLQLRNAPPRRLWPVPGQPEQRRSQSPFDWADVLAGDMGAIRRYAPPDLSRKTIVTEAASYEDVIALRDRGADLLITTMPTISQDSSAPRKPATFSAAVVEAILAALREDPDAPLSEGTYLNLLADLEWEPALVPLQGETEQMNRFAFVIHPLSVDFIHKHPSFRFTRFLPDWLVEPLAAQIPPLYVSRIRGAQSPATGQKVEGILLSLGATPRELMRRETGFTYRRLIAAARLAERLGARLMGLGAFTSVVGDAGITVAHKVDIGITSGNSLTVAATLEAAKRAVLLMGAQDLTQGSAMVIGATGSIGSVCSRLLAQAIHNVTLVAPRPEKLIALKRQIESETPAANITIATSPDEYLAEADLIVSTTTAINARILDITLCKPGAVICDVARPPDISEKDAALRPDVLVIESGEIKIPGDVDFGYDIGLPPGTAYACLAETALLAMEGRFDDYTLGREIEMERVKEIYRLFKKHGFELAGLRSHGRYLSDDDIASRRALADDLRAHPEHLEQIQKAQQVAAETGDVVESSPLAGLWPAGLAGLGVATAILGWWTRRQNGTDERE
jgi:predicted amino acid dehydrogenase